MMTKFLFEKQDHVLIDLETFGLDPGSLVVNAGLVRFNPRIGRVQTTEELLKSSFRVNFDIKELLRDGFTVDGETLIWWMGQSEAARRSSFTHIENPVLPAKTALIALRDFFKKGDFTWGNSPSFDLTLLESMYKHYEPGVRYPWDFRKVRCYRTIRNMNAYDMKLVPDNKILHDPVTDAIYEAQTLQAIAICNPNLMWE